MSRMLNKKYWPNKVHIPTSTKDTNANTEKLIAIQGWLEETVGMMRKEWTWVAGYTYVDYYFKTEQAATLFALRWA